MTSHPRSNSTRDTGSDPSQTDTGQAEADTEHAETEVGLSRTDLSKMEPVPPCPPGAADIFGCRRAAAERYVEWLADAALERGLMGPRERPRLWDRHVLNCAAVTEALPEGARVIDIGSGAGLPGIPIALARPDLCIVLVEPLLRRTIFLQEVIDDLVAHGTPMNVQVVRGRAEEKSIIAEHGGADVVTSRAVAPLAKLARWSVPLLRPGGEMVALKGSSAEDEVERDRGDLARLGLKNVRVETVSAPDADATYLVRGTRGERLGDKMEDRRRSARSKRSGRR